MCDLPTIYLNALAIYELDDDHRGLAPDDSITKLAQELNICADISCYKNKKFINKYCKTSLDLPTTIPDGYELTTLGDFNNNKLFMRCLDMLLYYSKSFNDLKSLYYTKNYSSGVRRGKDKNRSTHLYKGIKPYLIPDEGLNADNIITAPNITLPYYNSTSTNIYKSFLYAHKYPYSGKKEEKDHGHVFIINPATDAKCIDYIETFDKGSGYTLLSHAQRLHEKQYMNNKKYVYEQEILFNRFSTFTNIIHIGNLTRIINSTNEAEITAAWRELKPSQLILDTRSNLYNNLGLYSCTFFYNIFRQIIQASDLDITAGNGIFKEKLNLDIFEDGGSLDHFVGTRIYMCDLQDCIYTDITANNNKIIIPNDIVPCTTVKGQPNLFKEELRKYCKDNPQAGAGGSNLINYYQKYLKYKNKYLELKKINI